MNRTKFRSIVACAENEMTPSPNPMATMACLLYTVKYGYGLLLWMLRPALRLGLRVLYTSPRLILIILLDVTDMARGLMQRADICALVPFDSSFMHAVAALPSLRMLRCSHGVWRAARWPSRAHPQPGGWLPRAGCPVSPAPGGVGLDRRRPCRRRC